jgi:hypothetical protein
LQKDACKHSHIPERLKRQDRPVIDTFEIGEELYYRCDPKDLVNPFIKSPVELSHNRSGPLSEPLSFPEDVLFNIVATNDFDRYPDKVVCTLTIKGLTDERRYRKLFSQTKNGQEFSAVLELLHDPEVCMYPHSVFRLWINDELITIQNANSTISKLDKLRTFIKQELASMIKQRQVDQHSSFSNKL